MNKATTSIPVQVSWWTYISIALGHIPKSEIAKSYGKYMANIK